jgi:molybdopterin molybdotransferase
LPAGRFANLNFEGCYSVAAYIREGRRKVTTNACIFYYKCVEKTRQSSQAETNTSALAAEVLLPACFFKQLYLANNHVVRQRLAHIVYGKRRHRGCRECLHLNARLGGNGCFRGNYYFILFRGNFYLAIFQPQRVAEGDKLRGLLGAHDTGNDGRLKYRALFGDQLVVPDLFENGAAHRNYGLRAGRTACNGFGTDVNHPGVAGIVDMCKLFFRHVTFGSKTKVMIIAMVTVQDTTACILQALYTPRIESIPLGQARGRVLAERITADRDLPPFDRATMDGIALAYQAWRDGQRTFIVEGTQAAGMPAQVLDDATHAFEVMTGAVLPRGTDTVVRYEDITIREGVATVTVPALERGQSIHYQGSDARLGALLLEPGLTLSPAEVALLASVGKSFVEVFAPPRAAVLSTGDELVDVDVTPLLHQVRRSNGHALVAALEALQVEASLSHLPDDKDILQAKLRDVVEANDVIILSGGVSKGKFDFVPEVLESLGVVKHIHQVSQRPGKPFWFGTSASGKTVFALPGNPVSTFLCFQRYVRPWLLQSLGVQTPPAYAVLAEPFSFAPKLTYFLQVSVRNEQGRLMAYPDAGGGSGDFANLKNVTGFLELPLEQAHFQAGEVFPYWPFRT